MAAITKHGFATSKPKIYRCWGAIRNRCNNPNNKDYPRYGGRGIKVCTRWDSFENFIADMGPPPSPKHSIERIDNNGNYEPANCCWLPLVQQARNRRPPPKKPPPLYSSKVKALHRTGKFTFRQLGDMFGVSPSHIFKIVHA